MILLGLVLLVIVLVLLVKLAMVLTGRMVERFVNQEFRYAEAIMETGTVPEQWLSSIARRASDPAAARALLLKRLERMCGYFEKQSFFGNADDKALFKEQIAEVRRQWEQNDWRSIAPSWGRKESR